MIPLTDTHGRAPPRLEELLEVVTDGVLALDVQGRPTYVNTSAERILGRSRELLLGRRLWTELPGLEETELYRACHRALAEGTPATVEEYLASLGAWLEARVFPNAEGVLVLFRDVTPLKQMQAESTRLHALVMSAPAVAEQLAQDLSRGEARLRSPGEWVGSISDITPQWRARQALELISEASAALSSTLDLRQALERLTRSLVPRFAGWCGIYLRQGKGPLERVAFTDVEPVRALRLRK
ncbi:MAG TPA: PAS domain-containing protein, partial [Archangium sp.]|nr:PAS domain-containing protein [Archangium sp.]